MTLTHRRETLSIITLKRAATVAFAVAFALAAHAAPAMAASSVVSSGTVGQVFEINPPATCVPYDTSSYPNTSGIKTTAYTPTVLAAALANGSQSQWVHYIAALIDIKTGSGDASGYSPWALATVQSAAQWGSWASLSFTKAYDPLRSGPFVVMIRIEWWDPVSRQYTGSLQYTVNNYLRSSAGFYYFTPNCS